RPPDQRAVAEDPELLVPAVHRGADGYTGRVRPASGIGAGPGRSAARWPAGGGVARDAGRERGPGREPGGAGERAGARGCGPPRDGPGSDGPGDDAAEPLALEIGAELDLHWFAPRDVPRVLEAYLEAAAQRGLREVRIVHGRGTGVQRARVQELLQRSPWV